MLRQNLDQSGKQGPLGLAVRGTEPLGGHALSAPVVGQPAELVDFPAKDGTPVTAEDLGGADVHSRISQPVIELVPGEG